MIRERSLEPNYPDKIEVYIDDYYQEFKKDFNSINDEELKELLLNCLSKNQNFNLRILDEYFSLMIKIF